MQGLKHRGTVDWMALWLLFAAWSSWSGSILSAVSRLDRVGIALSSALFLGSIAVTWKSWRQPSGLTLQRIIRSRFATPRLWLTLATLALAGGLAYAPNNYDYLTYRFPRVLHWCAENSWYWIPGADDRMNYSGVGFEWMMAPLYLAFHTDRLFFLLNFIPYLFLPALVFSVLPRFGISRRIAWWWMWVFPCGYCFILQAASTGNDACAAVYFLASLHFLFRARDEAPPRNFLLSCVALALTTGVKASNLPLALPWAVVLFFERRIFLRGIHPALLLPGLLFAAGVSFVPVGLMNWLHTGDIAGDPQNHGLLKVAQPLFGIAGNGLQFLKDNLAPPLLPHALDLGACLPAGLRHALQHGFPRLDLHWGEMQIEESAGAGLGWAIFLAVTLIEAIRSTARPMRDSRLRWFAAAVLVALAAYFCRMGSEATSRLVAAYYPALTIAVLGLAAGSSGIVHRPLFRWTAWLAMLSAFPLVIVSPARPLFPAQAVCAVLERHHVPLGRLSEVYRVYSQRADPLRDLRSALPPDVGTVGILHGGNETELSAWRPFGTRRVVEVSIDDSAADFRARGVGYLYVSAASLGYAGRDLPGLLAQWSATVVGQQKQTLLLHAGPEQWYLLRLSSVPPGN